MTGPPLSLADLHRAYLAQQAQQGPSNGDGSVAPPRLRVPAAPTDATPSLSQLHAAYLAQRNTETGAQHAVGAARAFGQGATFGFGDEIEAGLRSMTGGPMPINVPAYVNTRDQIREAQHTYEGRHQLEAAGLEAAGGLASAAVPVGGAVRAATGLGRIGNAMRVGAGMGAAYGLGKGEGDLASQAKSTVQGAGYGAAGGAAFQSLGEGARTLARAVDASPRAADALAKVVPTGAVKRWAAGVTDRATARDVTERLAQDQTTPGQAAQRLTDTPEHIPLAIVDAGGENAREAVGAVKRLPGPEKNAIATRLKARDNNAPEAMRRTVREATDNQAAALGLDPATIDTRTANPNDVVAAARDALAQRSGVRYERALGGRVTPNADALGDLHDMLARPSMRAAMGYGEKVAAEEGRPIRLTTLSEAPPVFDEHGQIVTPAREIRGARDAAAGPPPTVGRPASAPQSPALAAPGSKLHQLLDAAENGHDAPPPASVEVQQRFYSALSDDALAKQWQRETTRIVQEGQRHAEGQWVRQTDDGSVVSGGSRSGGRAKKMGELAQARLGRVEREMKRRGFTDDHINALWGETDALPPRSAAPANAPTSAAPDAASGAAGPGQPARTATVAAPDVAQLHYLKIGLDRHIAGLQAEAARLQAAGENASAPSMLLRATMQTKQDLLGVINRVAPDYATAMRAHADEVAPISAFVKGRRLPIGTDAEEMATKVGALPSDNARAGLGAGASRRVMNDLRRSGDARTNPAKAVVGSGDPTDNKVQNLRLLVPKAAPVIENAADAVERMRQTSQRVLGGSQTTERALMNASLAHKAGALIKLVGGKPLAAAKDILGGTYGPQAQRTAEKLLLGAGSGERAAAVAYLRSLEATRTTPTGAVQIPRLRSRGVGTLAGNAGGTTAAVRNRP